MLEDLSERAGELTDALVISFPTLCERSAVASGAPAQGAAGARIGSSVGQTPEGAEAARQHPGGAAGAASSSLRAPPLASDVASMSLASDEVPE